MKRTDKMVYILENINANPIDRRIMVDGNGKGNPLTLLVGMQTSTATMENTVEIP